MSFDKLKMIPFMRAQGAYMLDKYGYTDKADFNGQDPLMLLFEIKKNHNITEAPPASTGYERLNDREASNLLLNSLKLAVDFFTDEAQDFKKFMKLPGMNPSSARALCQAGFSYKTFKGVDPSMLETETYRYYDHIVKSSGISTLEAPIVWSGIAMALTSRDPGELGPGSGFRQP